jgi:hypothetical protein
MNQQYIAEATRDAQGAKNLKDAKPSKIEIRAKENQKKE